MKSTIPRTVKSFSVIAAVTILFLLTYVGSSACADDRAEFVILHTNDFHGAILPLEDENFVPSPETVGGSAYIASKVEEIRLKFPGRVILLDAGDIVQGTLISNELKGAPVIDYMNYLRYDAMAIGNHELDWGVENMLEIFSKLTFPVLCANMVKKDTGEMLRGVKPYLILERDGLKIGIIGVITPDTIRMTFPRNVEGLTFLDPAETVKKYIREIQDKGIKVIILLSHLGIQADREMAKTVPGITAIIGGHSHTAIRATEKVNNVPIVQTGTNGTFLGCLRLIVNRTTGSLLFCTIENELHPIIDGEIAPDPRVEEILKPYEEKMKPLMQEVIGKAARGILDRYNPDSSDKPVGNFVTDVIREKFKTDVALYNTGGIRTSILEGNITRAELFTVIPFDNNIITIQLTGEQLLGVLCYFTDRHIGIQVSGMTYTYAPGEENKVQDLKIQGRPLDPEKLYTLATLDFVYYTSNDDSAIRKGRNLSYGNLARAVIEEYIREKKTVYPPEDIRIRLKK